MIPVCRRAMVMALTKVRKALIVGLALGAAGAAVLYVISFRPAPEWRWRGRYFELYQWPSGGWPSREVSFVMGGSRFILGIQTGHVRIECYSGINDLQAALTKNTFRGYGEFFVSQNVEEPWPPRWTNDPWLLRRFLRFPLWLPFVALATFPTLAFVRGPFRRWHRRHGGLCLKCGYDLTGNVSGVCPECGTHM